MSRVDRFRKILVAVAGPEDADEAVPVVIDLARAFGSEVLVLHVRERVVAAGGTIEQESVSEALKFGELVTARLTEAGIKASVDVRGCRPGRVAEAILAEAPVFEADLIVIGPHHAHGVRQHVFGDIAEKVSHGARCPVLLL